MFKPGEMVNHNQENYQPNENPARIRENIQATKGSWGIKVLANFNRNGIDDQKQRAIAE